MANEQKPLSYRGLTRSAKIPSCKVSIDDLRSLYRDLSEHANGTLEMYLNSVKRPADRTEEDFEAGKRIARDEWRLVVAVTGSKGEQLTGITVDTLDDIYLPDQISTITFDSNAVPQTHNVQLPNRFALTLDFTEPVNMGRYDPWKEPTPNNSALHIVGTDRAWVTGVYEEILSFFRGRERKRRWGWLHTTAAFNLLSWTIGLPGALWIGYRAHSYLASFELPGSLLGGILIYIALLAFLVFRILLGTARWAFPHIELEGSRSTGARRWASVIVTWLLLALLYDVLKTLFWPG